MRGLPFALCTALISSYVSRASATYSIVATDSATREVGGAGTSCLGGGDVYGIYGSAPGFGAVQSQARSSREGRDQAVELLAQGLSPSDIVLAITENDDQASRRQYGIVDLLGRTAGHSGSDTSPFSDDVQGVVDSFAYSIQGNLLTGPAVLTQARAAFEAGGCDLADRLMLALEAGGQNGEGDERCESDGIPSDSAFLQVDLPDAPRDSYLALRVPTSGDENPLLELRMSYEAWRATQPCPEVEPEPEPTPAGGSAGTGQGGAGAEGLSGGAGMEGVSGAAGPVAAGTAPVLAAPSSEPAGCGCRLRASRESTAPFLALLVASFLARRRKRPYVQ